MFRDSRAAGVMAPTTDALYDFIGRAACGLPLLSEPKSRELTLGAVAYDPKVVTIWDGFPRCCAGTAWLRLRALLQLRASGRGLSRADPRRVELAAGLGAGPALAAARDRAGARRSRCATPTAT